MNTNEFRFRANIQPKTISHSMQRRKPTAAKFVRWFYKTTHASNFLRHITRRHASESNSVREETAKYLSKKYKSSHDEYVSVKISRTKIQKHIIEMITVNGRSINSIADSGFMGILQPIRDAFEKLGSPLCLSSDSIKKDIGSYVERLRMSIAKEQQNKTICIQFDTSTLFNRNFLSVNATFYDNGVKIRSLAMTNLTDEANAIRIAREIIAILAKYEITLSSILACRIYIFDQFTTTFSV